jgi:hypothetical protein
MLTSAVEVTLEHNNERISDEQRPMVGQSVPIGDSGSGQTGVPAGERGIPNRPGDHALKMAADADADEEEDLEDDEDLGDDEDEEEDADDEDLDEDDEGEDDGDDGDDDALEDEEDETTDPGAEPGKPV